MDSRRTITLPNQETAQVREAKDVAATIDEQDHALVAFALKLIEAKDTWCNTKRRGAR